MTKWRDLLGRGGRPGVATGQQLPPDAVPQAVPIVYSQFSGLDVSDVPEDQSIDRAQIFTDLEINQGGKLVRAPGATRFHYDVTHSIDGIATNADIDGFNMLYFLAHPYIGRREDADPAGSIIWTNYSGSGFTPRGSSAVPWALFSVLGKLLISDGVSKTYWTDNAGLFVDISAQIVAETFAAAFGRVFAGAFTPSGGGGSTTTLGVAWNDSSGDPASWTGAGAGAEILIPNQGAADYLIKLTTIGFDLLVALCRNSIWFGTETGVADHPANFKQRYAGTGCFSSATVANYDEGVIFLSEKGLMLLTPGGLELISGAINDELLPLNPDPTLYSGSFNPALGRYILCTPAASYVYDVPVPNVHAGRFYKRSYRGFKSVYFARNLGLTIGRTTSHTLFQDSPYSVYVEDPASITGLTGDPAMTPIFRSANSSKLRATDVFTTKGYEIEYQSTASSVVRITTPDTNGDFTQSLDVTLPSSAGLYKRLLVDHVSVSMGVALQYQIISGSPKLARITQFVQPESQGVKTQ